MSPSHRTLRVARVLTRHASHFQQPSPSHVAIAGAVVSNAHLNPMRPSLSSNNAQTTAQTSAASILSQDIQNSRPPTAVVRRRPIPNSYWATPNLLACEYPWSPGSPRQKLDSLLAASVRTFIDLTERGELLQYQSQLAPRAKTLGLTAADAHAIEYFRFPIADRTVPSCTENLRRVLDILRDCEKRGRIAAVHCRGGIGRTGTVVGCWLIESGVARDGEEALRMIAAEWKSVEKCSRFPCSPETGPQCNFVRNFKRLDSSVEGDGRVKVQLENAAAAATTANATANAEAAVSW